MSFRGPRSPARCRAFDVTALHIPPRVTPLTTARSSTNDELPGTRNQLLSSLTSADASRLAPFLRKTELQHKAIVYDAGQPVHQLLFLESGMVSLLAVSPRGTQVETAVVGSEGVCGLALFHRVGTAADRAIVQAPGVAYSLDASDFLTLIDDSPSLSLGLHHFAYAQLALASQTSACNRRHQAPQRLARWLLLAHDRIAQDEMPLTHEFLAHMLGLRRSTVTIVADELRSAGAIQYTRGKVRITDRHGLELLACDCYRSIVNAFSVARVRTALSNGGS